jgi:hypothetical protein
MKIEFSYDHGLTLSPENYLEREWLSELAHKTKGRDYRGFVTSATRDRNGYVVFTLVDKKEK